MVVKAGLTKSQINVLSHCLSYPSHSLVSELMTIFIGVVEPQSKLSVVIHSARLLEVVAYVRM